MTSETCQVCGKTQSDCQGHDPTSSKQRLDAIRSAGPAQRAPVVTEAPSPSLSLKEQLDAIPAPVAGESAAPPAGGAGLGLKTQGDAPSSIVGRKTGDVSNLKGALDSIPTPAAAGGPAGAALPKDLLDSIPTPGSGAAALGGAGLADLDSIPTPGAAAPPQPQGEVPQWMKNYEQHQSSLTGGKPGGVTPQYGAPQGGYGVPAAPDAIPPSYSSSRTGDAPPQGSTYNMIIGIVVIICIVVFGYIMIAKPEPAKFPDDVTTPASTAPSTPTTTPTPVPTTPTTPVMPTTTTPVVPINSTPVPGAPQGMPTPMPAPGTPDPTAVPTTVPSTFPGNNPVTPGNNPVPVTPGNNP